MSYISLLLYLDYSTYVTTIHINLYLESLITKRNNSRSTKSRGFSKNRHFTDHPSLIRGSTFAQLEPLYICMKSRFSQELSWTPFVPPDNISMKYLKNSWVAFTESFSLQSKSTPWRENISKIDTRAQCFGTGCTIRVSGERAEIPSTSDSSRQKLLFEVQGYVNGLTQMLLTDGETSYTS